MHRTPASNAGGHPGEEQTYVEPSREIAVMGDYYDIRCGAIVAKGVDNLLVAGRCISADYVAQSSLRIQQTCISTGQAAGTAAALSLQAGLTPRELDPAAVVEALEQDRAVEPVFEVLEHLPRLD